MGVCKKIKRRADQERNVWELFRMFKNEKKILGLSESTLQNYEDSLKRFMDYMECSPLDRMVRKRRKKHTIKRNKPTA